MSKKFDLNKYLNPWLHNIGFYTAGASFQDVITEHGFQESDILKIGSNETTLGASPKAIEAAKKAIEKSNYYDDPYSSWFIGFLTEEYRKLGLDMDKVGIVVGNGMDYIIDLLGKLFLDNQSSIVISSPTFIYYKLLADWAGSEVIDIPRDKDFYTDPKKILASVKENTKIVFVCSPNNPTGTVVPVEDIELLAANLNCVLFVDHAYIQFADDKNDVKKLVEKYPNLVIGYTFSKSFALAGYRVGYGLMSKEMQTKYLQVIAPFANSRASLAAAKEAWLDTDHLNKVIDAAKSGREFLYPQLEELGFNYVKSETNFILMSHPKYSAAEITKELMKKAIIIRPMKSVCPNSIRVTIGTESENRRFIQALNDIIKG